MANYAENIFQAIDVIVGARLSEISYDTTVKATIINIDNATKGEYIVDDGSSKYKAYSETTTYEVDEQVYVSIPNGDYTQQKIITGKYVEGEDGKPFTYVDPMQTYVDISNNIIPSSAIGTFDLIANKNPKEKLICSTDVSGGKMFDRMGIQASFKSWLGSYKVKTGSYGLKVVITYDEPTNTKGGVQKKTHAFYLDSMSDFYGDPYNFTNFFKQKKVEDISKYSNISHIALYFYQNDDFILDSGQRLTYETDPKSSNLFISECYVSFGYDLSDFTEDKVLLYTLNGETYNDSSDVNTRKKLLQTRWIQYNDGDIVCIDTHDDIPENALIHWYKYELNEDISDELAGAFWQEISDNDGDDLAYEVIPDTGKNSEKFKVIIEYPSRAYITEQGDDEIKDAEYKKNQTTNKYNNEFNSAKAVQLQKLRAEKGGSVADETLEQEAEKLAGEQPEVLEAKEAMDAAIAEYEAALANQSSQTVFYESPILTLTNENQVIDAATIALVKGLVIECDVEGKKGNYKLYDDANYIMNTTEATKLRKLTATYDLLVTDNDILNEAESVTWMIPKESTMIYPPEDGKEYDLSIPGVSFNDTDPAYYVITRKSAEFPETVTIGESVTTTADQLFRIKDYYVQSYTNNTVQCVVTKAGMKYTAEFTMNFGPAGSNGTDYTFVLEFADKQTALTKGNTTPVPIIAKLFDYENNEIQDCGNANITYSWYSKDSGGGIDFCSATGEVDSRYVEVNTAEMHYDPKQKYFTTDSSGNFIPLENEHFYQEETISFTEIPGYVRVESPIAARLRKYFEKNGSNYKTTSDSSIDTTYYNNEGTSSNPIYILKDTPPDDKKYYKENSSEDDMGKYYTKSGSVYTITSSTDAFNRGTKYYLPIIDTTKTYYTKSSTGTFSLLTLKNYYDRTHDVYAYCTKNNDLRASKPLYTLKGFRNGITYFTQNTASSVTDTSPVVHIKMHSATSMPKYYIMQATINQDIQELKSSVKLTSYLVIPVRANSSYREFEGTTKIIYDAMSGGNPYYYKEPCQLYKGVSSTPENDIYWTIEYQDDNSANYYPTITSGGQVTPYAIYTQGLNPQVCICASTVERNGDGNIINSTPVWYQPLIITENRYASSMLNSWDGSLTIDEENGIILSSMVGAGKKESDNSYTGVLMGDIESLGNKNQKGVGVYGFEHGAQSFCLNTDGTAFFGKSGSGRIFFDGTTGVIKSGNYSHTLSPGKSKYSQLSTEEQKLQGMIIDLDDGIIDIIGETGDIYYNYLYEKAKQEAGISQAGQLDTFYKKNSFINDEDVEYNHQDSHGKTVDDYKTTKARITIQPTSPFLKIDSAKGHRLINIGSGTTSSVNDGFYLQSDNFNTDATAAYPYGAGTKIDLSSGKIDSHNFSLKATASYTPNDTNARYNGSYIKMNSDGDSYLHIRHQDSEYVEYYRAVPGVANNSALPSGFYIKNADNTYSEATGNFNELTAYYKQNISAQNGADLIDISKTKFTLHSVNYLNGEAGTMINMNTGRITSYNFNITAKGVYQLSTGSYPWKQGTITIDSTASKYPFIIKGSDTDHFRVRWDGQIEVGNGFKVESDGSLNAIRGSIAGWYLVEQSANAAKGIYSYNPTDGTQDSGVALFAGGARSDGLNILVGTTSYSIEGYYYWDATANDGAGDWKKASGANDTNYKNAAADKRYIKYNASENAGFSVKNDGTMTANNAVLNGAQINNASINSGTIGSLQGGTITGGTISGASISSGTITGASISGGTFTGGTISVDGMISCGGLTIDGAEFTPRILNADVAKVSRGSWSAYGTNNTFSIDGNTGYAGGAYGGVTCSHSLTCDGKNVTGTITLGYHRHAAGSLEVSVGGTNTQLIRVALKGNFLASDLSADEDENNEVN